MPRNANTYNPTALTASIRREAERLLRMDVTQPTVLTENLCKALDSHVASDWIKSAIMRLCKDRDPVDAIADAERLYDLLSEWYRLFIPLDKGLRIYRCRRHFSCKRIAGEVIR